MIRSVTPSLEILASYIKVDPLKNRTEVHRYESINGGLPKHIIEYKLYNSVGEIEQGSYPRAVNVTA